MWIHWEWMPTGRGKHRSELILAVPLTQVTNHISKDKIPGKWSGMVVVSLRILVSLRALMTTRHYFPLSSIFLGALEDMIRFKVARISFLARGVGHHRASRVRNTNDRGARFKTRKTKTNMAARGFFCPRSLLYYWRRTSHIKEALPARTT